MVRLPKIASENADERINIDETIASKLGVPNLSRGMERRNAARHPFECQIILLHTSGRPQGVEARLLNYSNQGLCFTSRHLLTPGTIIALRASGDCYTNPPGGSNCLLRSTALVKVKWCRECTRNEQPTHAIGAAYMINY